MIFPILTAKLRTAIQIMPNAQIDTTETKINRLSVEGRLRELQALKQT